MKMGNKKRAAKEANRNLRVKGKASRRRARKSALNYSSTNPNARLQGIQNKEPKKKTSMVWKALEEGGRPVLVPFNQV